MVYFLLIQCWELFQLFLCDDITRRCALISGKKDHDGLVTHKRHWGEKPCKHLIGPCFSKQKKHQIPATRIFSPMFILPYVHKCMHFFFGICMGTHIYGQVHIQPKKVRLGETPHLTISDEKQIPITKD